MMRYNPQLVTDDALTLEVVLGGRDDRLIPFDEVWRTGLCYGCSGVIIPKLAHAVMVDCRWIVAAKSLEAWLIQLSGR